MPGARRETPGRVSGAGAISDRLHADERRFRRNLPGRWERIGTVRDIGLWRLR
jgi:hypothetical protein